MMGLNNNFGTVHNDLLNSWDYEKNKEIDPYNIPPSSTKKVWWKCENGHSYFSPIHNKIYHKNCPYCINRRISETNNLKYLFPELLKEWNYNKNKLTPEQYFAHSGKKVWWKCKNGHEWCAKISNRTIKKVGCPYCSNKKLCSENSLLSKYPDIASEWNYNKNKIFPENILYGSNKKVWWKCKNGHEWISEIGKRTRNKLGCPFCSNKIACNDNSLISIFPDIAKEWNYNKNNLGPDNFVFGSSKKVWWKCKNGHEYFMSIYSRTKKLTCCPYCDKIELNDGAFCDSYIEAWYYIKLKEQNIYFEHNKRYGSKNGYRYDFFIPSFNTFVEVTGFTKDNMRSLKHYWNYLRKIVRKRKIAKENGSNFLFFQKIISREEKELVIKNMRKIC